MSYWIKCPKCNAGFATYEQLAKHERWCNGK
jgi:hypothetical protein